MVPDKDYFADKDGKLTTDPEQYAFQIAVAGVNLDDKIAKRFGIGDTLVSTDEPHAPPRRVKGKSGASVEIIKADDEDEEEGTQEPQEPVAAADEAQKPAAKKGGKKTK